MTAPLTINGRRLTRVRLSVPNGGPWFADVEADETLDLSGAVTVALGELELRGTVAPRASGAFLGASRLRVVGGGGGWGTELRARAYHNDAGVKARSVAEDAAREAGESLGEFAPSAERLGADYARRAGRASRALEDAAQGALWWVGYDGVTRVGKRATGRPGAGATVLEWDATARVATVALSDPSDLEIGDTLEDARISGAQTVRELELEVSASAMIARAWCGGSDDEGARLARLLEALVASATDRQLLGLYRYRCVSMAPDGRANLQVVARASGLPDLLPVTQRPGLAGAHAELEPGHEVLVAFADGDPRMPVIVSWSGQGSVPTSVALSGGTRPVARVGDQVQVFVAPGVPIPVTGTVSGAPFAGTMTIATPLQGVIGSGNPKVLA